MVVQRDSEDSSNHFTVRTKKRRVVMKKVRFALVFILVFALLFSLFSATSAYAYSKDQANRSIKIDFATVNELLPLSSQEKYAKLPHMGAGSWHLHGLVNNLNKIYQKGFVIVESNDFVWSDDAVVWFETMDSSSDYHYRYLLPVKKNALESSVDVKIHHIEEGKEGLIEYSLMRYLAWSTTGREDISWAAEFEEKTLSLSSGETFPVSAFLNRSTKTVDVYLRYEDYILQFLVKYQSFPSSLDEVDYLEILSDISIRKTIPCYAGPLDTTGTTDLESSQNKITSTDVLDDVSNIVTRPIQSELDSFGESESVITSEVLTDIACGPRTSKMFWIVGGVVFLCILIAVAVFTLRRHNSHSDSQKK